MIPQGSRSEQIAEIAKTGHTAINAFSLIKTIGAAIVGSIVIIIFMALGLPWYIGTLFILFLIGMVVLQIIRLKRISSIKL